MIKSSLESSSPLKGILNQVGYLLDDAGKSLQEEASKYGIFATKSSASPTSPVQMSNGDPNAVPMYYRTMSDIDTLKSVLSCPIFNRIVNVTNTLDYISNYISLHPSIGPSDINIDANGELILAPPIESPNMNNFISNKLPEYSNFQTDLTEKIINGSQVLADRKGNGLQNLDNRMTQRHAQARSNIDEFDYVEPNNKFQNGHQNGQRRQVQKSQDIMLSSDDISQMSNHDSEKLISNGNVKLYAKSNKADNLTNRNSDRDGQRLYRSNGHHTLNQVSPDNIDNSSGTRSNGKGKNPSPNDNPLYSKPIIDESNNGAICHDRAKLDGANSHDEISLDYQMSNLNNDKNSPQTSLQHSNLHYNVGSCSPSISAGSTVRLADECDSGASSYLSHLNKPSPSCQNYYSNDIVGPQKPENNNSIRANGSQNNPTTSEKSDSNGNGDKEIERVKVTLEKGGDGLGIIIAGYTSEKDAISGLFIKNITPGSAAAKSGKIRTYDQIIAVNGRDLLGYSNPEAVSVLRNTGAIVTLELERYLSESKYHRVQSALAEVSTSLGSNSTGANSTSAASPTRSSIPISQKRDSDGLIIKDDGNQLTNIDHNNSGSQPQQRNKPGVSIKNSAAFKSITNQLNATSSSEPQSYIPKAAQRNSGSNKVIETKQGARNTIDIRSPVIHNASISSGNSKASETYVNKALESETTEIQQCNTSGSSRGDMSDEFSRFMRNGKPEWDKDVTIIETYKDSSQSLGFTVKEYKNPTDPSQPIIMVTSITENGIADKDGRLSIGDLLIFVDDTNLEGLSISETVKALKKTNGHVRLGVLKLKKHHLLFPTQLM